MLSSQGDSDLVVDRTGSIWFDSVEVEETALLNVVRRDGAPLALTAEGSAEPLVEGKDFSPVSDPFWERFYGPHEAGESANLHEVPSVRALPGGRLRPGQRVTLDYYALSPVFGGSGSSCLTHPAIRRYMQQNIQAMVGFNQGFPGYLMSYDEMRTGHSCELCAQHGETMGDLLAEHLRNATAIARKAAGPKAELFIWDDMCAHPADPRCSAHRRSALTRHHRLVVSRFNPYHNAHADYFLINGTVAGSWADIPPEVNVMNWGPPISCSCGGWGSQTHQKPKPGTCPCHIAEATPGGSSGTTTNYSAGLEFFSKLGLRQTVGGYYDSRNGTGSAELEVELARGIPNITGFMYTTWNNEYDNMCEYAATIRRLTASKSDDRAQSREEAAGSPAVPSLPTLAHIPRSDWASVKDGCGGGPKAAGDGTADDTAALQSCFDAIGNMSNTQHTVYLPP